MAGAAAEGPVDAIVCFSTDAWGDMKRPGQLMLHLKRRAPVLYVEPRLSVTSMLKNWRAIFSSEWRARISRAFTGRCVEVEPGVFVLTPIISVPPQRVTFLPDTWLNRLGRRQERGVISRAKRAAKQLGFRSPLVWVTYPMSLEGWTSQEWRLLVYDCMDRWSDFPDVRDDRRFFEAVVSAENNLLHAADVVFCSAAGLYEAKRAVARGPVHLVRNAADVEHFEPRSRPAPADVAELPRPVVGYVGALADWVDFGLIRGVALLRPEWSIVLIGPIFQGKTTGDARALEAVSGLPNVHLLGPRPYAEVPAYLEAFDVATIPFRLNGLTEDTNPIKVYEYLAAGVGVVSTPLPEIETLPEVRVAADAETFVVACEDLARERHDPEVVSGWIATAEKNSWEARADAVWAVVEERLSASRS